MIDNSVLNNPIFQRLIVGAVPILLKEIAKISPEERLKLAKQIGDLCIWYEYKDRDQFEKVLTELGVPVGWIPEIMKAIWHEDQSQ